MAALGLVCIVFSLLALLRVLQSMMLGRAESLVSKVLGKSGWAAILIGVVVTALVRSSSIVTSLCVPMAAAGIVTVAQIFPITIGANIGTTVTALIAALAGNVAGLTIALVHLFFNLTGLLMFYPVPALRRIPVALAEGVGRLTVRSRKWAVVYVFALFYGIPGLLILASWLL